MENMVTTTKYVEFEINDNKTINKLMEQSGLLVVRGTIEVVSGSIEMFDEVNFTATYEWENEFGEKEILTGDIEDMISDEIFDNIQQIDLLEMDEGVCYDFSQYEIKSIDKMVNKVPERKVLNQGEEVSVTLEDEAGKTDNIELIVKQGPHGVFIEFPDDENHQGVMLDLFDGELSVKIWTDRENEDFTEKVKIDLED